MHRMLTYQDAIMKFLEEGAAKFAGVLHIHGGLQEIVPGMMRAKHFGVLLTIMNEHTFGGVGELPTQDTSVKKVSS